MLEEVARLSVRLAMQAGVDAEVDAFLQRVRYERRGENHPSGFRNGWQPEATIKTTMGPVKIQRPKVRDTDEKFCSRLLGKEVTPRTRGLFLATSGDLRWPPARTQAWPLTAARRAGKNAEQAPTHRQTPVQGGGRRRLDSFIDRRHRYPADAWNSSIGDDRGVGS
ncbi:MAG: transposase [Acidimicrobiia bacterium]